MSTTASSPAPCGAGSPGSGTLQRWQSMWVRLAIALAFADASVVVLALPQILQRLNTSIDHVTWVIMAYNLALIVTCAAVVVGIRRLPARATLMVGLGVFGLASIGCGVSTGLTELIVLRCLQGVGGALVLAASLPLFARAAGSARALDGWAAAAAIGAAIGPAAGGVLTQAFDWRAIFLAQAPVAAVAGVAAFAGGREASGEPLPADGLFASARGLSAELGVEATPASSVLDPLTADGVLLLLSAAIIGALFLVVIELINAWLMTPIAAAAVVSAIPLSTAAVERALRGRSVLGRGAGGAVCLVAGLVILALLRQRELGWVIVSLLLCGAGLGLAFPGLTTASLSAGGSLSARAAKTVAARDAGLLLGLLVLTPVFSTQLRHVSSTTGALAQRVRVEVLSAPLPFATKVTLGLGLETAYQNAGPAAVPRIGPAFAAARAGADPAQQATLDALQRDIGARITRAVTPAFGRPYGYAALFALAALPLLVLRLGYVRRRGLLPPSPPKKATDA